MSFDFSRVWPLALLALAGNVQGKTVIAAVGDSVTAGDHGLPPFASDDEGNYPFFLQGLLDDAYPGQFEVANLGLSGATASDGTNKPYVVPGGRRALRGGENSAGCSSCG